MTSAPATFNGTDEITKLADLITESVKDVVNEYRSAGHEVPALSSVEPGPFDEPHLASAKLSKAIQIIEAACAQLSFAVANPGHVMTNKAYGYEEPAALQVILAAKIPDKLIGHPDGLPAEELAKQSGLEPNKLRRILRMLATKHCFRETKPNVFANNRLSVQLLSTNPVYGLVGHMTDETLKASVYLNDTLTDPTTALSTSVDHSPFVRAHGVNPFKYYDTEEGKKVSDRFAQAMVGWGEVTGRSMLPKSYDWASVPKDATICDLGGGNGHAMVGLVQEFPHIQVVLQDLPPVLKQGQDYWAIERPEDIKSQRIKFVSIDFLKESPVPNCNFYYLRHVLHDWPTSECHKILENVRKAMGPESRLLIHEFVLQHAVRDSSVANQAPQPLLANYGMGRIRLYHQDINMMNLFNSQERTLQEFIDMGQKAGFKFQKLWDAGEAGLVEFTAA